MKSSATYHLYVEAFIKAICYKFAQEEGAISQQTAAFTALSYHNPLTHPWPRKFQYHIELFTANTNIDQLLSVIQSYWAPTSDEHLLNLFNPQLSPSDAATLAERGYHLAWTNLLMCRALAKSDHYPTADHITIRPVQSKEDIDQINALNPDYPSHLVGLTDPYLHEFVAKHQGRVVGKAQLITVHPYIAYISDMFVEPHARQLGLGGHLINQLHQTAAKHGLREVILLPSQMTRQSRFYEKHSYRPLVPMHLFIPTR